MACPTFDNGVDSITHAILTFILIVFLMYAFGCNNFRNNPYFEFIRSKLLPQLHYR